VVSVTVGIVVLVSERVLSDSLSGFGSVVCELFEIVGWDLYVSGGEEGDLDIVGVWVQLIDASWHLSVFGVGYLVEVGGSVVLLSDVFLGVVLSSLDSLVLLVWDGTLDLEGLTSSLIGWDLSVDGVLLVLEGGDWDKLLDLEGLLVSDGLSDLSLDLVLLGVVLSHGVVLGDSVWDLAGSLLLFLDPDGLWSLLVISVFLSVVLSAGNLDLNVVVLVLVNDVGLLLVDLVWDLGGGGVWDSLGDGVWDLGVDGVVLSVVFDAIGNVCLSVWDDSWDSDLLVLGDLADDVLWNLLGGPVGLFFIEAIIG